MPARTATTAAATAAERCQPARQCTYVRALVEPGADLLDGGVERLGWEPAVIGQRHSPLLDARRRQRSPDRPPLARAILGILGQVEHPPYAGVSQRFDVVVIKRVRADGQVVEHVGESV
jgi:hypothetical protein